MRLLLFLTLISFSEAKAQEKINLKDSLGRKQGHWIFYGKDRPDLGVPANGKVEEGKYIDDRKEGYWTRYYEDGVTVKLIGEYSNSRPSGHFKKYYANGTLKESGQFIKDKYIDSLKRYYENGQLEYESFRDENGVEAGIVNWYYPTGELEQTMVRKNGVVSGCKKFDRKGNVIDDCNPIIDIVSPTQPTPQQIEAHKKLVLPTIPELPNTNGIPYHKSGYNKIYNTDNEIWFDGVLMDGKLWDGKYYEYDQDDVLNAVLIYKEGKYSHDGQL